MIDGATHYLIKLNYENTWFRNISTVAVFGEMLHKDVAINIEYRQAT